MQDGNYAHSFQKMIFRFRKFHVRRLYAIIIAITTPNVRGVALRRTENGRELDAQECSTEPHVYWDESQELILKEKHGAFMEQWNENYQQSLHPDALPPRESLIHTLPSSPDTDANVIFWSWIKLGNFFGYQMSAYTTKVDTDEVDYFYEHSTVIDVFEMKWAPPNIHNGKNVTELQVLDDGKHYVAFFSLFSRQYQHVLIDHVGYLAYLKQEFGNDPNTKLLIQAMGTLKDLITLLDPEFSKNKIHWIGCTATKRLGCLPRIKITNGGSLSVVTYEASTRHGGLFSLARQWVNDVYTIRPVQKTIVYYTRNHAGAGALHGRQMDHDQEIIIRQMIQHFMERYKRTEKFVVFDGTLSTQEQIVLFRSASVVIGPHGGGLANILWMASSDNCESRPKVLEFATSPQSRQVQYGDFKVSYHTLYPQVPWVEFHQLFFTSRSTKEITFLDLDQLRDALQVILAPHTVTQ